MHIFKAEITHTVSHWKYFLYLFMRDSTILLNFKHLCRKLKVYEKAFDACDYHNDPLDMQIALINIETVQ